MTPWRLLEPGSVARALRLRDALCPLGAIAACFAITLAAGLLAGLVPAGWQGNWTDHVVRLQPHFVDRFWPFDAVWYRAIASGGYIWDPTQQATKQDIAFFPVWPLIERLTARCTTSTAQAQWSVVTIAAASAAASVYAFHRLAGRVLPMPAVNTATFLFALYPGAGFLLLAYPTGLMNLLCILAMLAMLDGRLLQAAFWCAVLTGTGPLGLGTALTVCFCALRRWVRSGRRRPGAVSGLAAACAICALSVSGLVIFIGWQFFVFGDGFAFIKAQRAWAVPQPWPSRLRHSFMLLMILPDFAAGARDIVVAIRSPTLIAAQAALERVFNEIGLGALLIGVTASLAMRTRLIALQAGLTMLLFVWFHSATRPGIATFRLTYCSIGCFLGIAWLLRDRPVLSRIAIYASASLLAGGAFLSAAGYHFV